MDRVSGYAVKSHRTPLMPLVVSKKLGIDFFFAEGARPVQVVSGPSALSQADPAGDRRAGLRPTNVRGSVES
jgi:hypothetical protein